MEDAESSMISNQRKHVIALRQKATKGRNAVMCVRKLPKTKTFPTFPIPHRGAGEGHHSFIRSRAHTSTHLYEKGAAGLNCILKKKTPLAHPSALILH